MEGLSAFVCFLATCTLLIFYLQPVLYSIVVRVYGAVLYLASTFVHKARQWVNGRRHIFSDLALLPQDGKKIVWFHCASLGEFEQGRPVIEGIREEYRNHRIVVTFFSPSGYTVRKDYSGADLVTYLPLDTSANARKFLAALKPDIAIFVKYEFWYHLLKETNKKNIPIILIAAQFRKSQLFFRWFGILHREMLRFFTHIFVPSESALALLRKIRIQHASIAFDTRFDRVLEVAHKNPGIPEVEAFVENFNVLVAGSTWPGDERILSRAFYQSLVHNNFKLLLAPHHIEGSYMRKTMRKFKKYAVRWSEKDSLPLAEFQNKRVLIIDNFGMLTKLYAYGDINYVGGGLNKGVHNTLEAAVYGKPVIFGMRYEKFEEAADLVRINAALVVRSEDDLLNRIKLMNQFPFVWKGVGDDAREYVNSHSGGAITILSYLRTIMP